MEHFPPADNARRHTRNPTNRSLLKRPWAVSFDAMSRSISVFLTRQPAGLFDQQTLVAIVSLFAKISAATLTNAKPAPTLKIFLTSLTRVNAFQTVT
jgi:hypothetical protein